MILNACPTLSGNSDSPYLASGETATITHPVLRGQPGRLPLIRGHSSIAGLVSTVSAEGGTDVSRELRSAAGLAGG